MESLIIWSAWVGGIAIGLYAVVQFWLSNRQLGCSLAYGNIIGLISGLDFFHKGQFKELNNWRLWFILGVPLGGMLAAYTSSGSLTATWSMGQLYDSMLPESEWLKAVMVTFGGILLGFGARLAGGCTAGHVISGGAQLNPPSIIAAVLFFIGGLFIVQLLYLGFS